MTTPAIERLIEAVKYFVSSDENQIKPTSKPVSLKEAKAGLLELAKQAEGWKFPHAANAHDRSRGRARAD
jgi:hypothetical protein